MPEEFKREKHHDLFDQIEELEVVNERLIKLSLRISGEAEPCSSEGLKAVDAGRNLALLLNWAPGKISNEISRALSTIEDIESNLF